MHTEANLLKLMNENFKIVLEYRTTKRIFRHYVSANQLKKYIGHVYSFTLFLRVLESKQDKCRFKHRKGFIIDFYQN